MTETTVASASTTAVSDAVVVWLGTGRFAVALASVAEVGRVPVVTRIPGMPAWLAGAANWRGRVLPVLDLRAVLGATVAPLDGRARLLVLTDDGVGVGLLVESVEGTTSLTEQVESFPSVLTTATDLLAGQVPDDRGPIAVLHVPSVMRMRESLPRGRRSA